MLKENIYFIKKSVRFSRLVNAVKSFSSYCLSLLIRKSIVWGYPPIVMFEPTNICNLKCPLCPSGNGTLKRPKGYMKFSLFQKVIDEIKNKTLMLILWNQGEPFLNKDFLKMTRYASDRGLYTLVSTNGNIMPDAEDIVNAGIDRLIFSLDGATQETYNKYRINGKLSLVLENAKKIIQAKKRLHSKIPLIEWQFIVMKHNEHEIDSIKKLASELEVDLLQLKTVQIYAKEDINNFLPKNPKFRRYKINGDNFELKYGIKNRCRRIWTQPVINWDGEVAVCCFDKNNDFKVGNVKNQSFINIWKNSAFQKVRNQILKDRKKIPMCNNCGEGMKLKFEEKRKE